MRGACLPLRSIHRITNIQQPACRSGSSPLQRDAAHEPGKLVLFVTTMPCHS